MEKEHPAYRFDDIEPSEPNTQEEWIEAKEKEGVPTTHKEAMERLKAYAQDSGDNKAQIIAEKELAKEKKNEIMHKLDQLLMQDSFEGISSFLATISGKEYTLGMEEKMGEKIEAIAEKWPQQEGVARKCRRVLKELKENPRLQKYENNKEEMKKLEIIIAKNKKEIDILSRIIDNKETLTIMAYGSRVMGTKSVGEKWDDYGTMDWSVYNVVEYKYNPKESSISTAKEGVIMSEEEFYEWSRQYEDKAINQMVNATNNKEQSAKDVITKFPKLIRLPALAEIELRKDGSGHPKPFHFPTFAKSDEAYHLAPEDEEVVKKEVNNYLEEEKKYLENNEYKLDVLKKEQSSEMLLSEEDLIAMRWKKKSKI